MARKPGIHYPERCITLCCVAIMEAGDRDYFSGLLGEGVKRYEHRIHAFCLMRNHLHLLIQVSDIPLSKIMQNVSFRYTRLINEREKATGHLFQGRYKAIVVEREPYLLERVRYIHLNPVRAGLVKRPEESA